MSRTTLEARGRLNALQRHRKPDDPEIVQARGDLKAASLEKRIREAVASAPPLSKDQKNRLSVILSDGDAD